jgi:hypothetical protein
MPTGLKFRWTDASSTGNADLAKADRRKDGNAMLQTQPLPLPEALELVEKIANATAHCTLPPELLLTMTEVLKCEGNDVPAYGMERETAALFCMVNALCLFDRCNAAIVTDSVHHAEEFFQKPLFSSSGPDASDFAPRFDKRLVSAWNPIHADELENIGRLALHLNEPSSIPVFDFLSLEQAHAIVTESAAAHANTGWLKKLVSAHEPESVAKLRAGLEKLNCVVKVIDGVVSADGAIGVGPVLKWAASHQLENAAR